MKKPKSKAQIESEYKAKMLNKTHQLQKRYDLKKEKEQSLSNTYWDDRCKKDVEKRTKKYADKKEKEIKNLQRVEKGHKPVVYKESVKKLTKTEMLAVLQKYARLRDSNEEGRGDCICCGLTLPWKGKVIVGEKELFATGGHYINSQWNATAYDLDNINFQCNGCNNKMHKGGKAGDETKDQYRKNLIFKIGLEKVLNLEVNKSTLVDTRQWLTKDTYEHWQAKVNELERTKTLSY